ncbi:MAG: hypothetical protein K6L76_13415 [Agarilytica sp.]
MFRSVLVVATLVFVVACSGGDNGGSGAQDETSDQSGSVQERLSPESGLDSTGGGVAASERRILDASDENLSVYEVNTFYTVFSFGPMQNFLKFRQESVVVQVVLPFPDRVSARIHLFDTDDWQAIDRWINNQHSDGLYVDVPEPQSFDVSASLVSTAAGAPLIEEVQAGDGNTYEVYQVEYFIESHEVTESLEMVRFSYTTNVHVPVE